MAKPRSTVHQVLGADGKPYTATGCFNPWIGNGPDVFAMPREGNKAVPLLSGKDYYADLITSVDAAQSEVLILGWQVSWDALLAPGVRLYDLLYRNAKRGVKFYVMPWDDTNPVQTYDDQTRIVFEDINKRLGLSGNKKAVYVLLSGSFAGSNTNYFSHHQKCVVVDRKIGYMGGIDLSYGRYDSATYTLKPDADGRAVMNRYNPCIAWIKALKESDVVDPDLMSGALDNTRPSTMQTIGSGLAGVSVPLPQSGDDRSSAEMTSDKAFNGGWQAPYQDNAAWRNSHSTDANTLDLTTLDERMQPRMPWQDVHCRIEGPVVSDMVRNFVVRWNIGSKIKLALPESPATYPKSGSARIQFLRSAPAAMRLKEYAAAGKEAFAAPPAGTDDGIQRAMIRLIENAAHFVYIESQFFVSEFGKKNSPRDLSPVGEYIRNSSKGIGKGTVAIVRQADDLSGAALDQTPQNGVCGALIARIQQAIFDASKPRFHVYITLPVHPEGDLMKHAIAAQVYWTMQSIAGGSHSLLNGIRRALRAKELKDKKQPYESVLKDPANKEYEKIPVEACDRYVTLLNLRNWAKIGQNVVTEQIYIHSKLMVVDDRFALLGSANVNDRSLLGERDSEIAVLVIDTDTSQCDVGTGSKKPVRTFARDLRMGIWKKIFGITGNVRPASHLKQAIEQPANPASWQAIQKQAKVNAEAYEKAFPFVPKNWSGAKDDDGEPIPCSVLPSWVGGGLSAPMPSQPEFWKRPQFKADGVAGLESIKGFITALPIHWAKNENLDFKLPTAILVQNDPRPGGVLSPVPSAAVASADNVNKGVGNAA
ncbi:MAG: Phospholipase D/Transphosphatidylase [Proteobacteria bacterium]|nr:Phospholipase D/Transphosphatidylase [Pseudomonadota bacterium]